MRDKLIKEIYRLEEQTGLYEPIDLKTKSNEDLLRYYGELCVELYLLKEAENDAREC